MHILKISDDFWNLRGAFRIGGIIDIGTQASLVRLDNGGFVLLDSLTLDTRSLEAVKNHTGGGRRIEAIINLHPFHTVHVQAMHEAFPQARLYGTQRHHDRFTDLPWEPERAESEAMHKIFAGDLAFSVPRGVDFISPNPNLHFSSVLAYHRSSHSIHVDDTLMVMRLPGPLGRLGARVAFHPTLAATLERRVGAAQEFRGWVAALLDRWSDAQNLCAAHTHALLAGDAGATALAPRIDTALRRVEKVLSRHEKKYG